MSFYLLHNSKHTELQQADDITQQEPPPPTAAQGKGIAVISKAQVMAPREGDTEREDIKMEVKNRPDYWGAHPNTKTLNLD